jgi:hypothetical protein
MTENRSECRNGAPPMSYQVACFSCGYRRVWPALTDAVADGRHHAEEFASCARPALVTPLQPTTQECLPGAESNQSP